VKKNINVKKLSSQFKSCPFSHLDERKNSRHSKLVDTSVIRTKKNPFAKDWKFLTLVVPGISSVLGRFNHSQVTGLVRTRATIRDSKLQDIFQKISIPPHTEVNISRNLAAFLSHLTMKSM